MQTPHYTGKHYRMRPLEDTLECKSCASDAEKDCKLFGGFFFFPLIIPLSFAQSTQDAWRICYSKTDYATQLLQWRETLA